MKKYYAMLLAITAVVTIFNGIFIKNKTLLVACVIFAIVLFLCRIIDAFVTDAKSTPPAGQVDSILIVNNRTHNFYLWILSCLIAIITIAIDKGMSCVCVFFFLPVAFVFFVILPYIYKNNSYPGDST